MKNKEDLEINMLNYEIKEIERIYEQELGKKPDFYYPKERKREPNSDRIERLKRCITNNWVETIGDMVEEMKKRIEEREHKTEDFSSITVQLNEIEDLLKTRELDKDELKKLYNDKLRKIVIMTKSKIEIEKTKRRSRIKDAIINIIIAVVFFVVGILFQIFFLKL